MVLCARLSEWPVVRRALPSSDSILTHWFYAVLGMGEAFRDRHQSQR